MNRPCLDCGVVTTGTRCPAHRRPTVKVKPAHHRGDFASRSARVRATPGPCWICGEGDRPGDPWTADHLDPGNPHSELAKAHRSCNSRRGQARRPGGRGRGRRGLPPVAQ